MSFQVRYKIKYTYTVTTQTIFKKKKKKLIFTYKIIMKIPQKILGRFPDSRTEQIKR